MDTVTEQIPISEAAAGPRRVQGDAGSAEQHSLADLIAADKHLAAKRAARNPFKTFTARLGKISPGGAGQ